jgi:hypothetical protein
LTKTSGTTDLNQSRTHTKVNEISAISASGSTPVWAWRERDVNYLKIVV